MTASNILPQKELQSTAGDPGRRDRLLFDKFGITGEELVALRAKEDVGERILEAARLLYGRAKIVAPGAECQQLTELTIASIVYEDWRKPDTKGGSIHNYLKRHNSPNMNPRLKPSQVHFVRAQVGAYSGNIEEAAQIFSGFEASDDDFLKSITIPTRMSPSLENLLGVFYVNGIIPISRHNTNLVLERAEPYEAIGAAVDSAAGSDDVKFRFPFFDTLPSRIRSHFNIITQVYPYESGKDGSLTVTTPNGPWTYATAVKKIPRVVLPSKALITWLVNDLSLFTPVGKSSRITEANAKRLFNDGDDILAFLAGIVDAVGNVRGRSGRYPDPSAMCDSLSPDQKYSVSLLRQMAGYSARNDIYSTGYVGSRALRDMFERDLLANPVHIAKLDAYYGTKNL